MKKVLAVVLAISAVVLAGPVWAVTPTYTVTVGGSSAPVTYSISAVTSGSVSMSIKNNAGTVVNTSCTSISASGKVFGGTGINPWAQLDNSTWSGCAIPGGPATITPSGSWRVTGTDGAVGGWIPGYLGDLYFTAKVTANASVCSFAVQGAGGMSGGPDVRFEPATQRLAIAETGFTHHLKVVNVSGCLGQIQLGNPVNLVTTFNVSSAAGPINVS